MHLLAIEIGGTKLQLCAGTPNGEILDRIRLDVDRAAGGAGIRTQIAETIPR
jgi:predicted NBD/HSP70 family sugar kinase